MKMRYAELDASYAATHDLLTALLHHSESHVVCDLLCVNLCYKLQSKSFMRRCTSRASAVIIR